MDKCAQRGGRGGGFFTLAENALQVGAREQAVYFNELQKLAIGKTRLGIPLLQSEEGTHGMMCSDKTSFPEGLAVGSTWNMDLVRQICSTAAREARAVWEVFLPPWIAGIKAGALGVMVTYPAIDGVAAHASPKILTHILREQLGFQGLALGEGGGVHTPIQERHTASPKEAGQMVLRAGEGKASMADIDRAVGRILRQKFRLGLFDHPYVDPDEAVRVTHTKENQELALQVAREGIVLFKNDQNLLPLNKNVKSIAVIGPNADDQRQQLGDYTPRRIMQTVVTMLAGVKAKVPNAKVTCVQGCDWLDREPNMIAEAVVAAGKPTVLVLSNGRPLAIRWAAEHVPAIVEAWNSGERGGQAVADVLFGDTNPSGRLAITFPRHAGQLPMYYNYMPSKAGHTYVDMPITPLWEFGYGLSYTKFEYANLTLSAKQIGTRGSVEVSADVSNVGSVAGQEVVQLYVRDVVSSVTRPVKELKGFRKIALQPGEKKTVKFTLTPEELAFYDQNMVRGVEPGMFNVMVGSSSEQIRLNGSFEVR